MDNFIIKKIIEEIGNGVLQLKDWRTCKKTCKTSFRVQFWGQFEACKKRFMRNMNYNLNLFY